MKLQATKNSAVQKDLENHKRVVSQLQKKAEHHLELAKYQKSALHGKSSHRAILAQGFNKLANESQREYLKRHALQH